jgi:hypothetical protein
MELNVPTSGAVSHESPAVVQLHEDTKVPVSEIKARLHDKVMELNRERLANPSEVPYGDHADDLREQSYKEVEDELVHPEETETVQDDEFKDIFGDTYPGSEAFSAPAEEDETLGGVGEDTGFGGGIDNSALGFSDEDMEALNGAADNAFDEFTADEGTEDASDVNNISAEEPGAVENATDTATDEASPEES